MKLLVTRPTPIGSGSVYFDFSDSMFAGVRGIALFNPTGEVSGAAIVDGSRVNVRYSTTSGPLGSDYPIMTIALAVRPDAPLGQQSHFALDPSSSWVLNLLGRVSMQPIPPATITVAGTVSITNVVPGGGMLPVGTVVSIHGIGFQPKTQVQVSGVKLTDLTLMSPNEIQFTVAETTNMTGKKIQVVNPDGSQDLYYSYLRGVPLGESGDPLLNRTVPIFANVTHNAVVFGAGQFTGVALQNPNLEAAVVNVAVYSANGAMLGAADVRLPAGMRLMRGIAELIPGVTEGSYLAVRSEKAVQVFAFAADSQAGTVTPLLPLH
jgi:hypothetical protein